LMASYNSNSILVDEKERKKIEGEENKIHQ